MILRYTKNESENGSHFFIKTQEETLHVLSSERVNEEEICFEDDYLQENLHEISIARLSQQRESFCKSLSTTIKHIFDSILFKEDDRILYITIEEGSSKHKLINRYIDEDNN